MINLLPPDIKEARVYGRRNRGLMRWCIICFMGILGIGAVAGVGYFYINNAETSARNIKNQNEAVTQSKGFIETEKTYASFTSNLKTVVQILNKQILFSDLIQKVGAVTPPGARLSSMSLTNTDNALDLNFIVEESSIAPVVQLNLEDPKNELFEKADIVRVTCEGSIESNDCTVQVRALYRTNAQFLFLNSVGGRVSQ